MSSIGPVQYERPLQAMMVDMMDSDVAVVLSRSFIRDFEESLLLLANQQLAKLSLVFSAHPGLIRHTTQ